MLTINTKTQTLTYHGKTYAISTAKNGVGEVEGSFCTPTGRFRVSEKIGEGLEVGSVLVGRVPTGEVYSTELGEQHPDRDWILTRILWLEGVEVHNQNTKTRYIYIHGAPDDVKMGVIGSRGCVRMKNNDVIEVFDKIDIDEVILIQ